MRASIKKSMKKKRLAGMLLPISALPSIEGVGTMGASAYKFVDILSEMGMSIWQILPLNPLGFGNSPYQPFSSFAGDEIYIDLQKLYEDGYLTTEVDEFDRAIPGKVNYDDVRGYKSMYLRTSFINFKRTCEDDKDYQKFCKMDWVRPYAVFVSLKRANDMRCWNEWPKAQKDWIENQEYDISILGDQVEFEIFLQYMFYKQWNELKEYANSKNILIMGDIPFYVGIDSLDVWQSKEDFLLDTDGRPRFIAGVPPDYFSVTGQRWGNPIYDWDHIKENNFDFWINRLSYSSQLYDIIRIDHFRAFDTFWKIPAHCPTAVEGQWIEAPGYDLLDTIFEKLPNLWMVAEDLGDLRYEVLTLRDHYELMGMYVTQFNILNGEPPAKNQLAYTGTHDNQTVKGWYLELDGEIRRKVDAKLKDYGLPGDSVVSRAIKYVMFSDSNLAIIPAMDVLELDDIARLNAPGTVGPPNWEWRMDSLDDMEECIDWIKEIVEQSLRKRD